MNNTKSNPIMDLFSLLMDFWLPIVVVLVAGFLTASGFGQKKYNPIHPELKGKIVECQISEFKSDGVISGEIIDHDKFHLMFESNDTVLMVHLGNNEKVLYGYEVKQDTGKIFTMQLTDLSKFDNEVKEFTLERLNGSDYGEYQTWLTKDVSQNCKIIK